MLNTLLSVFKNLDPMNWNTIKHALTFLWQGLLAIFVTIALIIIVVKLTALCIDKAQKFSKERQERIDAAKAEAIAKAEQENTQAE
ncbi:MAG: hypothetical protein IJY62_03235 [Clostridia bacterium]|nr:hypothetical protein [Clostridia bacterium]